MEIIIRNEKTGKNMVHKCTVWVNPKTHDYEKVTEKNKEAVRKYWTNVYSSRDFVPPGGIQVPYEEMTKRARKQERKKCALGDFKKSPLYDINLDSTVGFYMPEDEMENYR